MHSWHFHMPPPWTSSPQTCPKMRVFPARLLYNVTMLCGNNHWILHHTPSPSLALGYSVQIPNPAHNVVLPPLYCCPCILEWRCLSSCRLFTKPCVRGMSWWAATCKSRSSTTAAGTLKRWGGLLKQQLYILYVPLRVNFILMLVPLQCRPANYYRWMAPETFIDNVFDNKSDV